MQNRYMQNRYMQNRYMQNRYMQNRRPASNTQYGSCWINIRPKTSNNASEPTTA
jgi:hypothetical protein